MPAQTHIARTILSVALIGLLLFATAAYSQQGKAASSAEWDKLVEAARKEGKIAISLPASAELKKQIEEQFRKRFAIEVEVFTSRGATGVRRMADEFKAGVRYFDLHIGGSSSILSGMYDEGIIDAIDPWLVLSEVRDPKQWWGGHLWVDSAKRFIYMFQAYLPESIWYNSDLVKPSELRSFEDLLNPKWKGKIGFLDPRTPGGGDSHWSYMWQVKGEDYLKNLAAQDLFLGRDQRVLSESLAKGRIAVLVGNTFYSFQPFVKAGLPVKPLPTPKEGTFGTGGSGNLAIIKAPAHPNATKVFVNWLLSHEGQEVFSHGLAQATRRNDVDTKWLRETGTIAAKDTMSVEEFWKVENQSEEKFEKVRKPAAKAAQTLLK
ncbi:MAG: extracellular solute-binding protein [Deltaproteobacteria bacterium]|nr:extracellular solute-binding protein [Deltaproteobacteria bacterium]